MGKLRVVAISDTHLQHERIVVPDGDVLVHAGDITLKGELSGIIDFNSWLGRLPHKYKLVIAGNHDLSFEWAPEKVLPLLTNAFYLQDSSATIEGINFYGSPWQLFYHEWAFNLYPEEIVKKWKLIPADTDVLITHSPPFGILDRTFRGQHIGCPNLGERVSLLKPKFHVFGHVHEDYGVFNSMETTYINATSCNLDRSSVREPIVFEVTK